MGLLDTGLGVAKSIILFVFFCGFQIFDVTLYVEKDDTNYSRKKKIGYESQFFEIFLDEVSLLL